MNARHITHGILSAAALTAMLGAAPAMAQQTTTYPPGTDCRKLAAADQMKCKDTLTHPLESGNNGSLNSSTAAPSINSAGPPDGASGVGTSGVNGTTASHSDTNGAGGTGSSGN
jgi:hypothetical protein